MNQALIFLPMLGMMLLTAIVWGYMYVLRIRAMRRARLPVQTYTTPDSIALHLKESDNYPAYNLKNLCELPLLFYSLCIYLFVMQAVDGIYLFAAYGFLLLRIGHSWVHCTRNIVLQRFYLYAAAAVVFWLMVIRALLLLLQEIA